ncbi:hypothetical protein JCM14124_18320 [Humidesulfovibrio idahonensis]
MKVKNLNGTSTNKCKCDSWLDHWENGAGKKATLCAALDCSKFAELGGHVIKSGSSDRDTYIIPLCPACNSRIDTFDSGEPLVSANVSKTCGN